MYFFIWKVVNYYALISAMFRFYLFTVFQFFAFKTQNHALYVIGIQFICEKLLLFFSLPKQGNFTYMYLHFFPTLPLSAPGLINVVLKNHKYPHFAIEKHIELFTHNNSFKIIGQKPCHIKSNGKNKPRKMLSLTTL